MVGFQGLSLSEGLSVCVDTSVINNSMFCCSFNGHRLESMKGERSEKALKYCYIVLYYLLCHIHVDLLKKILLCTEHIMFYIKELRNMSA